MLVEHWPWQKRPDHWPAVGRHDTEAVEAEGAEAEAIAIPVTKPCWPPRYMRRSLHRLSIRIRLRWRRRCRRHRLSVRRTSILRLTILRLTVRSLTIRGLLPLIWRNIRRINLPIEQKPQHQRGQRESKPSCPRQTDGNKAAQQRANAIPIPLAVNQILSKNLIVALIRQHKPRQAIERGTRAEKQCGNHHKRTNQRGIPTKTTCYAIAHAANPTVMSTLDLAGTNPREETAAAGSCGEPYALPMIRLSSRSCGPALPRSPSGPLFALLMVPLQQLAHATCIGEHPESALNTI